MDLKIRGVGLLGLSILALVVGVVTGFGAVFFRMLIALIHNVAFLGKFSFVFDANQFTPPSPWGAFVILVPVIGGLIVVFLVVNFAPEARGHGVPEVLDAIYYKEGKIRPVVAAIKSLASAFSIGTGAAVGREGPIIQIGATLGSSFGQMIPMIPWQRITLVAAGAGAGIAATFNTPIGGVMFAIELMLPEISARTFLPVALATGAATFIGRIFLGLQPAFQVPSALYLHSEQAPIQALLMFALLGVLIGLAATAFIRGLVFAEDIFPKIKNPYLRHIVGMLMVGTLMYALLRYQGHYFVEGVGYATIQAILHRSACRRRTAARPVLRQAVCHLGESGLRRLRRHLLALAVHGRDAGRRLWRHRQHARRRARRRHRHLRHHRHGGDGRRRHRRGDDRGHHDLRDDPRLRHHHADHRRGGAGNRRAPPALAREHLHHQAGHPRPSDPEGAARQHVPGAPCRRGDGPRRGGAAGGNRLRRLPARNQSRRLPSTSW